MGQRRGVECGNMEGTQKCNEEWETRDVARRARKLASDIHLASPRIEDVGSPRSAFFLLRDHRSRLQHRTSDV